MGQRLAMLGGLAPPPLGNFGFDVNERTNTDKTTGRSLSPFVQDAGVQPYGAGQAGLPKGFTIEQAQKLAYSVKIWSVVITAGFSHQDNSGNPFSESYSMGFNFQPANVSNDSPDGYAAPTNISFVAPPQKEAGLILPTTAQMYWFDSNDSYLVQSFKTVYPNISQYYSNAGNAAGGDLTVHAFQLLWELDTWYVWQKLLYPKIQLGVGSDSIFSTGQYGTLTAAGEAGATRRCGTLTIDSSGDNIQIPMFSTTAFALGPGGTTIDSCDVFIDPAEYWPFSNQNGDAVYNTDTGAQLVAPFP